MSAFLKYWLVKVLGGKVFLCLRPTPLLWPHPHPPPPHIVYVGTLYLFTQGRGGRCGELTREKVRGAMLTMPVENANMTDCLYNLFLNSNKHQYRRHLGFGVFTYIWPMLLPLSLAHRLPYLVMLPRAEPQFGSLRRKLHLGDLGILSPILPRNRTRGQKLNFTRKVT